MSGRPWTVGDGGVVLAVRLTPRGGRDAIEGVAQSSGGPVLQVRVRPPPHDGEANAALIRMIARALGVAPRAVSLIAGASARVKRLKIAGSAIALAAALETIAASGKDTGGP